jgi:hypothetical protein
MKDITTLLNAGRITAASLLVFGLASAGATAGPDSALHVEGYKAMSMRHDLAHFLSLLVPRTQGRHVPCGHG